MRATYLTQSGIRLLHDWGAALRRMFPAETAYLVGSALTSADYRDVDVRLMLDDDGWKALTLVVNPADLNLAVSLWGQQVTGLPIDFQVQRMTDANAEYDGRRHPLGRLGDPAGVPGGGEPQPTTSTDTDTGGGMDVLCTRCLTPGRGWRWRGVTRCEPCHRLIEGDQDTDTLILSDVSAYGEWWTDEYLDRTAEHPPVRSAGGGDQPTTPCPECGGRGVVIEPPNSPSGGLVPCPAPTDKETPHGQ